MKKDLKIEILDAARNLFNEVGYNGVSMRNIADVLNISVGNLTYHYKRKEDLVEAVVMERHKNYKKSPIPQTLEELNRFFKKLMEHHNKNPYYFNHYTQLAQLCPNVYQIQVKVMQDMFDMIKGACLSFGKSGLMKKEDYSGQYDCVVQSLVAICIYNFPNINSRSFPYEVIDKVSCLWSIIYLLLSEKGKKAYNKIKIGMEVNMILETERLYLREMEQSDFTALCKMLQDEEVMYAYEHAFSDKEAHDWLDRQIQRYKDYGFGLWAVVLKETDEMIGQCGLTMQDCEGKQVVEIGYLFQKAFWHKGYATEAAKACKKYAFDNLDIDEIFSIIRDMNLSSQNVAKRNGMSVCGSFIKHYYNIDMPHFIFSIKREEYHN